MISASLLLAMLGNAVSREGLEVCRVTDVSPTTRPETPNHQLHRTHCSGLRPLSWAGELTR
jgi:hypothetical protein